MLACLLVSLGQMPASTHIPRMKRSEMKRSEMKWKCFQSLIHRYKPNVSFSVLFLFHLHDHESYVHHQVSSFFHHLHVVQFFRSCIWFIHFVFFIFFLFKCSKVCINWCIHTPSLNVMSSCLSCHVMYCIVMMLEWIPWMVLGQWQWCQSVYLK